MPEPDLMAILADQMSSSELTPTEESTGTGRQIVIPSSYHVPEGKFDYIELIRLITDGGVLGLMGNSGSGKTHTCLMLARVVSACGGRVKYIDTEHNLNEKRVKGAFSYEYIETFYKMVEASKVTMRQNWDLLIVDSSTIFITAMRSITDLKESGDMHSKLHTMYWDLNHWSMRTGCAVVITMQPASTMMNPERRPVADKLEFFTKNLLDIKYVTDAENNVKRRDIVFAKGRDFGNNHIISKITIDDDGARLDEPSLQKIVERLRNL